MTTTIRRTSAAVAALAALACAGPATSHAGTIETTDTGALHYQSTPGESNHLTVREGLGGIVVEEQDVSVSNEDPADCDSLGQRMVVCSGSNVTQVYARMGDGVNYAKVDLNLPSFIDGETGSTNEFHGGPKQDLLIGADHDDQLFGGGGNDELDGGGAVDYIVGGEGADTLRGGEGGDLFTGEPGPDDVDGGPGVDHMDYAQRTERVAVTLDDVDNDGSNFIVSEGDNVRSSVEQVLGGSGDDHIIGSDADNRLTGYGGNDILVGGGGSDFITGFDGEDRSEGGPGDDTLRSEQGADTLIGGDGSDTVSYAVTAVPVTADLDDEAGDDGAGGEGDTIATDVENLLGGLAGDTLLGNAGTNRIDGERGGDTVDGGAGSDELLGNAGDDTIRSEDGVPDAVDCGAGNDYAAADEVDTRTACELPVVQQPEEPKPQDPGTGDPVPPATPVLSISPKRARLDRRGYVTLKLTCSAAPCSGRLALQRKGTGYGSRTFKLAAGASTKLRVKVGRRLRTVLGPKGLKVSVLAGGARRNVVLLRAKRGGAR